MNKNSKREKPSDEEGATAEAVLPPRDRIVSSATELFRKYGIRGIGVDAIAEAAHTNKMTLYRQFGSKDDLICETLRQISNKGDVLWQQLEKTFPNDPMEQLRGWVESRALCLGSEPFGCDLANAAVELKDQDHPAYDVIENFKLAQRERLVVVCRAAGIAEAELLADTLSLLLEGARVSRRTIETDGPSTQFKKACDAAIASFARP